MVVAKNIRNAAVSDEAVFFRNICVSLRPCLHGVLYMYASAYVLDSLDLAKKSSLLTA